MGRLEGKVAWITGAGSGIGAAAALALAEGGAVTVLSGRRREPLEVVEDRIGDRGLAEIVPVDVREQAQVEAAAEQILERHGRIDVLVNSAGINVEERYFRMVKPDGWRAVVDTNLNGTFYCIHAVLSQMRLRGEGLIINLSSWVGRYNPTLGGPGYPTTKRAVIALTETLNWEENVNGIRACCICPAEVDTELLDRRPTPPPAEARAKMLKTEDMGNLIRWIAELPPHICVNEIVISPTWNRFHITG